MNRRLALISGSSGGIGLAIGRSLAQSGCDIALTGIEPQDAGDATARTLAAETGVGVSYTRADLRRADEVAALVDAVQTERGIDIVVNNAVLRHFQLVEDFHPEEWEAALAVNLTSAFHFARLCVPGMKARGWGRIVNVASIYGTRGAARRIDYVTSKAGILGMTRALAIELAKTGITCNAVSPGTVLSDPIVARIATQARAAGIAEAEARCRYLEGRNPNGRFIGLEAVGGTVAFLCGDGAADINGIDLPVDGGWSVA